MARTRLKKKKDNTEKMDHQVEVPEPVDTFNDERWQAWWSELSDNEKKVYKQGRNDYYKELVNHSHKAVQALAFYEDLCKLQKSKIDELKAKLKEVNAKLKKSRK